MTLRNLDVRFTPKSGHRALCYLPICRAQIFGSSVGDVRGIERVGARMRSGRKKYEPSDWRLTMEQIGRELGKIYRRPQRLPRRLRILLAEVGKSEMYRRRTLIRKDGAKDPDQH